MLHILTAGELQFLIETLEECARASDDVEDAVDECLEILTSLDTMASNELLDDYE